MTKGRARARVRAREGRDGVMRAGTCDRAPNATRARAMTDARGARVRGTQEQERGAVEREPRTSGRKFNKTHRSLTAYERKKYVLKLLYIYMLGYNVDFGHTEALKPISSTPHGKSRRIHDDAGDIEREKRVFEDGHQQHTHRCHLEGRDESVLGLFVHRERRWTGIRGFFGGRRRDHFCSRRTIDHQAKKAALCLLRLFRKNPEILLAETFAHKIVDLLDAERDLGVLIGVLSLLLGIVQHSHRGYEMCVLKVINVLERLTVNKDIPPEYSTTAFRRRGFR